MHGNAHGWSESRYGEIVDINLVRDKATGKSKGFAFLAYEDQRSTVLAVDNLNGYTLLGRMIRVDHVLNYKGRKKDDDENPAEDLNRRKQILPRHLLPVMRFDGCPTEPTNSQQF